MCIRDSRRLPARCSAHPQGHPGPARAKAVLQEGPVLRCLRGTAAAPAGPPRLLQGPRLQEGPVLHCLRRTAAVPA
eukprot:10302179-Alexandrium_andersonii.AAC.1